MRRRARAALAVGIVAVVVGSAVAHSSPEDGDAPVQPAAGAQVLSPPSAGDVTQPAAQPSELAGSAQPAPSPSASAQPDAHGEDLELGPSPAPVAPAQWDPAAAAAAQEAARAAMVTFARPDLPAEQWWEQLQGHLSAPAQGAYVNVDPRLVPCRLVQSAGPAQRAGSDLLAVVPIVTDAGTYEVLLSRVDGSSGWLVERLTPQV